jgi:hypothetical protein
MAVDKQQAIGRAQRVGRTNNLIVHNLCFEHELENNEELPTAATAASGAMDASVAAATAATAATPPSVPITI